MVLFGVAAASALVLYRDNYWFIGVGLIAGMLVPLLYFLAMQTRWRVARAMQTRLGAAPALPSYAGSPLPQRRADRQRRSRSTCSTRPTSPI